MGIFGTASPFDQDIEKATSENNTAEEWGLIMEICDRAAASAASAKECLRSVLRRLAHPDPHVALQAVTVLDACVSNCGKPFHLEVASRDFETEFRRLLGRAQPAVAQRMRALLHRWAEGEFRTDPQLALIPSLHAKLQAEGQDFAEPPAPERRRSAPPHAPHAPHAHAADREQEELARAIALSLQEARTSPAPAPAPAPSAGLYPSVAAAAEPEPPKAQKVRALYDFEAAEDNELTFLAGEIIHVTDSTDPNWWKGYNARGEGLFPSNFVTSHLDQPPPAASEPRVVKSVQFAASVEAEAADEPPEPADIDEAAMDAALAALHDANPEDAAADPPHMMRLEGVVYRMGPLIDAALQRADRRHARLTQLSADLVDALNLYHSLMREPLKGPPPLAAYMPQQQQQQQTYAAPHAPHVAPQVYAAAGGYAPAHGVPPAAPQQPPGAPGTPG